MYSCEIFHIAAPMIQGSFVFDTLREKLNKQIGNLMRDSFLFTDLAWDCNGASAHVLQQNIGMWQVQLVINVNLFGPKKITFIFVFK